jgi:hypothetical protein
MLLMPIIPTIPLVPCTAEDEYDSDEELKAKKRKTADEIRSRFSQVEAEPKVVACKMYVSSSHLFFSCGFYYLYYELYRCHEPIAALPTLESHEDRREGGFRLTRTFGMAYAIPDNPLYFGCRNLHQVGLSSEND